MTLSLQSKRLPPLSSVVFTEEEKTHQSEASSFPSVTHAVSAPSCTTWLKQPDAQLRYQLLCWAVIALGSCGIGQEATTTMKMLFLGILLKSKILKKKNNKRTFTAVSISPDVEMKTTL